MRKISFLPFFCPSQLLPNIVSQFMQHIPVHEWKITDSCIWIHSSNILAACKTGKTVKFSWDVQLSNMELLNVHYF